MNLLISIGKFTVISGIGWIIDFSLYTVLLSFGLMQPLFANLISATLAVTFVYFTSVKRIFVIKNNVVHKGFILYLVYQCISISFFSWLIAIVSGLIDLFVIKNQAALFAKILVTPFTLATNYLFMKYLTEKILNRALSGK